MVVDVTDRVFFYPLCAGVNKKVHTRKFEIDCFIFYIRV